MNKKTIIIIILLIVIGFAGVFIYRYFNNDTSNKNANYSGSKISSNNTTNYTTTDDSNNNFNLNTSNNTPETNSVEIRPPVSKEEEISSFTTKIYTKDSERQNNIDITCSSLNDTVVSKGATFSFCDTVGKATSNKGYQKADVFKDGEVVQALGGGNCQVSSTLYNSVLNVPTLEVTERHSHSNSVPYIESGKDAAVAYGSYDFKFVNNSDFDVKIKAEHTEDAVIIKLLKIS